MSLAQLGLDTDLHTREMLHSSNGGFRWHSRQYLVLLVIPITYCRPLLTSKQILVIGMFFFPESPRHLMATDREDEALVVLKKLHYNGSNGWFLCPKISAVRLSGKKANDCRRMGSK